MKVLGLIGSYRKLGNTEILVKEALLGAKEGGADIDLVRLPDLEIKSCKGCMACIFRGDDCRIEDDLEGLFKRMVESDGILLGAPTYILGPPGIVKLIVDRSIQFEKNLEQLRGKVGASIVVSGVRGWEAFTQPLLNLFFLYYQIPLIDQLSVYAQGPGEILLNPQAIDRARTVGVNLTQALSKTAEERKYVGPEGLCPSCHTNLLRVGEGGSFECPLCAVGFRLDGDGASPRGFHPIEGGGRWGEETHRDHFKYDVVPSGERFLRERSGILKKLDRYRW